MYCMTVTYPVGDDTQFDMDYYRSNHIPLCEKLFSDYGYRGSVLRTDIGKGPGKSGAFYASIDLLFESEEHLKKGLAAAGQEIAADIPNYTDSKAEMTFGSVSIGVEA